MIKFFIGGFFGFMIGLGYGIYIVVNPEPSVLSGLIEFVAKSKGVFDTLF